MSTIGLGRSTVDLHPRANDLLIADGQQCSCSSSFDGHDATSCHMDHLIKASSLDWMIEDSPLCYFTFEHQWIEKSMRVVIQRRPGIEPFINLLEEESRPAA